MEKSTHSDHHAMPGHDHHGPHIHAGTSAMSHPDHQAHIAGDFQQRFWISLGVTVPILILSPMFLNLLGIGRVVSFPGDDTVLFLLSTLIYLYGGYPFLAGLVKELRRFQPGMMTLIGLAITIAYVYSGVVVFGVTGTVFFWEVATLIDIMLLGHWIEMRSVIGASQALESLARLLPKEAHKLSPNGVINDIPLTNLVKGDRVLVRPGERVPADGRVFEGETSLDESMLTGESKPIYKRAGDPVIAGAVNGEGSITVSVEKTGNESFLSQVMGLVKRAQETKSHTQTLADRAAFLLTIIALASGVITLIAWTVFAKQSFAFAIERMVTVMVISCPHALGLAIPLVVAVSTALAASYGFIIRDRSAFEKALSIRAVVFDKTGTLTRGKFTVSDVIPLAEGWDEKKLLRYAAGVESRSEHPIARGINEAAGEIPTAADFRAIPGKGVRARIENREIMVVSPGYLAEQNLPFPQEKVNNLFDQGKTVVFLLADYKAAGAIALDDVLRPESREAVARLKAMGIACLMLTGDNKKTSARIAAQAGIEEYFAEVLPQDKAEKIQELQARGWIVAMAGDGVNDAPALAQADVGIAVGAGTDVAIESAGIILVRNNPLDLVSMIELSSATYRKMVQNLVWAAGYNIIAIPLAAGVLAKVGILLSPAMGAILMSLSTVIVAVNAQLLRHGRTKAQPAKLGGGKP